MLKIAIIFLIFCNVFSHYYPPVASATNTEWTPSNISPLIDKEIQDALLFSNVSTGIVEEYIQYKLPMEAKSDGDIIMNQFKKGLSDCERLLKTVANIWEYKQCGSALLRDALAALAALQQNYRPYAASSASRPILFGW